MKKEKADIFVSAFSVLVWQGITYTKGFVGTHPPQ